MLIIFDVLWWIWLIFAVLCSVVNIREKVVSGKYIVIENKSLVMYIPENFKKLESCLVVCPEEKFEDVLKLVKDFNSPEIRTPKNLGDLRADSKDLIVVYYPEKTLTHELATQLMMISKPGSKLVIQSEPSEVEFILKVNGFINLHHENCSMICEKPTYQLGSSASIEPTQCISVWKIDDEEIIDTEELLDENDLLRPDPNSLRVCGSTGQRKACKNCSCGLAEEMADMQSGSGMDSLSTPKPSCGNCYLGDAFRCASCPYLGMPAFKPGEKIQISDNLLNSDL